MLKTVGELLDRYASENPNDIAFWFDGESHTWLDCKRDVDDAIWFLQSIGVHDGTHVGIWGLNSYAWVITHFACMRLGAIGVLINPAYRRDEMNYLLDYANVEVLAVGELKGDETSSRVSHIKNGHPDLHKIISLKEILNASGTPRDYDGPSFDDVCYLMFTSGTTSRPKAVMMTYRGVLTNAGLVAEHMELSPKDVQVINLPFFHGSGANASLLPALIARMPSVIERSFASVELMKDIEKYHVTVLNTIPSLMQIMVANSAFGSYDLSSLRCSIWAGAAVAPESFKELRKLLPPMDIVLGYGLTEASTLSTMTSLKDQSQLQPGMCGKPFPGIEIKIVDKQGNEVLQGHEGEIRLRGGVMKGYYGMPEKTAATITSDGWLKTGDKGYLDSKGNLHFVARMDDLIIRGGENISPIEIEQTLLECIPGLQSVKVLGVNSKIMGQQIAAFFTADHQVDCSEARKKLIHHLAKYKIPDVMEQVDKMPTLSNGKIDIPELKRRAEQKLAQMKR